MGCTVTVPHAVGVRFLSVVILVHTEDRKQLKLDRRESKGGHRAHEGY